MAIINPYPNLHRTHRYCWHPPTTFLPQQHTKHKTNPVQFETMNQKTTYLFFLGIGGTRRHISDRINLGWPRKGYTRWGSRSTSQKAKKERLSMGQDIKIDSIHKRNYFVREKK